VKHVQSLYLEKDKGDRYSVILSKPEWAKLKSSAQEGDQDLSRNAITRVVQKTGEDVFWRTEIGVVLFRNKLYEMALEEFKKAEKNWTEGVEYAQACPAEGMPSRCGSLGQSEFFEIMVGELESHDLGDLWVFQLWRKPFESEFNGLRMGELDADAWVEGNREGSDRLGSTAERENEANRSVVLTIGNS
jgi:hypothetical protein